MTSRKEREGSLENRDNWAEWRRELQKKNEEVEAGTKESEKWGKEQKDKKPELGYKNQQLDNRSDLEVAQPMSGSRSRGEMSSVETVTCLEATIHS